MQQYHFLQPRGRVAVPRALFAPCLQVLNVWIGNLPAGIQGWAQFPNSLETSPNTDGVVVLNTSLPGVCVCGDHRDHGKAQQAAKGRRLTRRDVVQRGGPGSNP